MVDSGKYLGFVVVSFFFSSCRGHLKSPVLSERTRIATKPSFGQKVHRFSPAFGLTQSRAKNRTFLMKARTEDDVQGTTRFWEGGALIPM